MKEFKDKEKLPEGWKRVKLGEVVDIISGIRPKGGATEEGIPSLGGEHITSDGYISFTRENEKFIPVKFYSSMKKGHARQNDILINKDGANTGKVGLLKYFFAREIAVNEHIFIIRAKGMVNQIFLFYWLFSYLGQREIKNKITGSAQPGLSSSFAKEVYLDIPPLPEQQKIAEILETVDKAIEKTDKIIEKYKRIKQGLMQELLTKGIDEKGNIRSEKTHKFKDSPVGRIPEEWEVVKLGEVVEIYDDQRIPLDSEYRATIKGDIPYCGATGIIDYINDYIFDGEYVLIAEDGGKFGRFEETAYIMKGKFWANNHVHIVRGKDKILDNRFLMYWINFKDLNYYISGSTREKLNRYLLKLIFVVYPPLPEQQRIAEILSQVDKAIEKEQNYKEKLKRLKQGLMEDLLTGKVRVNNLIEVGKNDV